LNYDYIIVGAGPAGASCAYLLKKKNKSVLLIDKENFPRKKVCGGVILLKTTRIIKNIYGKEFFNSLDKHEIKTFSIKVKDKLVRKLNVPTGIYTIDREYFDNEILKKYIELGGDFAVGKLTEVDMQSKEVLLEDGRSFNYKNLIGADGANSKVRKYLEPDYDAKGICVARVIDEENIIDHDNITMHINSKDFGYTFKIPFGAKKFNTVSCYKMDKTNFAYVMKEHNKHFEHKIEDMTGSATLALSGVVFNASDEDSIALIGDAAGLTDPISGKGIYYAMKSAKLLSKSKNVAEYEMKLKRIVVESDKKMKIQRLLSNKLYMKMVIFFLRCNMKYINRRLIIRYLLG